MKTYGRLWLSPPDKVGHRTWHLVGDPHVAMRAKRVFHRLSRQHSGALTMSFTAEACHDLEWFIGRYPLAMSDSDRMILTHGANRHRKVVDQLEAILSPDYTPTPLTLALQPRSYQLREAEIYRRIGGLLIGDDVGLGKTVSAICSFVDPKVLPAAVVTYSHLQGQWQYEIGKFLPDLRVHIMRRGTPYELPRFLGQGPDVVVLTYHKIDGWHEVLASYCKSVVFDEIQELRHNGSQRYNAAAALASKLPFRLGLSATPVYNYGGEIFNILDVLRPGVLGTRAEFHGEWCGQHGDAQSNAKATLSNPKAFGTWARDNFLMVRHTRREVGRELPKVTTVVQDVDTDRKPLEDVQRSAAELAKIVMRRSPELVKGERFRASQEISLLLRQATGIAKANHVADFVRLLVDAGESVVLAGWHRAVYAKWQDRLKDLGVVLYTGSETAAEKEKARLAFMKGHQPGNPKDKVNVLILSLRSGAGLNGLQEKASVIVFGELDWSPGVHEQCVGRLNRDGQKTPVIAYYLVTDEGSDPAVSEVLGLKREQIEGIRNPTEDFLEELQVDPEHAKRLARMYLDKLGIAVEADDATPLEASA